MLDPTPLDKERAGKDAPNMWCRFCGKGYTHMGWLSRHEAVCEDGWQDDFDDGDGEWGGNYDGRGHAAAADDDDGIPVATLIHPSEMTGTPWIATVVG